MSSEPPDVRIVCVDAESLELLADGELPPSKQYFVQAHLAICGRCRAALDALQEDRQWLRCALGTEDERHADDAESALRRVEAQLAHLSTRSRGAWRRWLRLAAVLLLGAASILAWTHGSSPGSVVSAAPGVILDAAYLRGKAWIEQPGKVLHWQVDSTISGSPLLPDGKYRTLHWVSNVPGARGSILRKFDAQGQLVFATWTRDDGSDVAYRRGAEYELVVHPPPRVIRAQAERLSPADRRKVERYLERRVREAPEIQRQRSAEWFVRIARAQADATLQQIRTEDGRDAYSIQEDVRPAPAGLKRLVIQTFIEADGYRRYRLRTTRERLDGSDHLEDSRWSGFEETTLEAFDRHALADLLGERPVVVLTAAQIARRGIR